MYKYSSDEIINQIENKVAAGESVKDAVVYAVHEINKEWKEIAKRYCNGVEEYSAISNDIKELENIIENISLFYAETVLKRINFIFESIQDDIKKTKIDVVIDKLAEVNAIKSDAVNYIEDSDLIKSLKANTESIFINSDIVDVGQKLRDGINSTSANSPYHMRGHAEMIIEAVNHNLKNLSIFKNINISEK